MKHKETSDERAIKDESKMERARKKAIPLEMEDKEGHDKMKKALGSSIKKRVLREEKAQNEKCIESTVEQEIAQNGVEE